MSESSRPIGITAICFLFGLQAVVALVSLGYAPLSTLPTHLIGALVIGNLIIPVAQLGAAYGLWGRHPWGWNVAAPISILLFVQAAVSLAVVAADQPFKVVPRLHEVIVPLLVMSYLFRSRLLVAFGWSKEQVASKRKRAAIAAGAASIVIAAAYWPIIKNAATGI